MTDFPYDQGAPIYEIGGLWPIPIMGKDMPVKGATGYDGTVTAEKIMQWLHPDPMVRAKAGRGHSVRNVGLRHQLTVAIDVDDGYGKKNGLVKLAEWAVKMSLSPLPGTWSSTARGDNTPSRQYIYTIPEDVRMKTKPCDAVELCNWHHRFTVCAPSIHPGIGKPYAWYLPGEAGVPPKWGPRTDRYPRYSDFTALPADWLKAFRGTAANADRSISTIALPELLGTFQQGAPDGLIQYLIDQWSDEDTHVGHDEAKNALIHAFLLGREGYVGVPRLVELLVDRLTAYLEVDRPDKAAFEAESLVQACATIAQQKPVKPKGHVTVVKIKRGDVPTPEQFMSGARIEFEDEPQTPPLKTVDADTWSAFCNSFTSPGNERMALNRMVWIQDAMRTAPQPVEAWFRHAVKAFVDVVYGRYGATRAVEVLTATLPAGFDPDYLLRAALSSALDSLEGAAA